MAVNDTRELKNVEVVIRDQETGRVLMNNGFKIIPNSKLILGHLPGVRGNELWLIVYKIEGETFHNHYVAYQRPMKYEQYRDWLTALLQ